MTGEADAGGPPRAAMIAALVLGVVTIGAVLVIAATRHTPQRAVALPAVPAPQATSPACQALLAALPRQLGDFQRAELAQPAPEGASAWQSGGDAEPVVVRCGLPRPDDFMVGSPIQVVDKVQWFQAGGTDRSTWYTVDRPVYVAITLPTNSGPAAIQELSSIVDRTLAAVPIDPAPPR